MSRTLLVVISFVTFMHAATAAALPIDIPIVPQVYFSSNLTTPDCLTVLYSTDGGVCSAVTFDVDDGTKFLYAFIVANPAGTQNEFFALDAHRLSMSRLPRNAEFGTLDYTDPPDHPFVLGELPVGIHHHTLNGSLGGALGGTSVIWFTSTRAPVLASSIAVFSTAEGDLSTIRNDVYTAVPEPGLLLLVGGGVLAWCRRRRAS